MLSNLARLAVTLGSLGIAQHQAGELQSTSVYTCMYIHT